MRQGERSRPRGTEREEQGEVGGGKGTGDGGMGG